MDKVEIQAVVRRGLAPLTTPEPMRLSQWAAKHFYLSAESSYVEGKWSAYPYQTAIMDCISHDGIREISWRKSARVGYTKIVVAGMGYFAQHKRRNQCVWQPTDDDSDEFVKNELEPMLRDVSVMRSVFPEDLSRDRKNTLRQKTFLGSILYTKGGKAAKNYRRISIDVAWLDELDAFDLDVEKEGKPPVLAKKRTEGATYPKLVCGTTPGLKGFSLIEDAEAHAHARYRFHISCPHCGRFIQLRWGGPETNFGLKWHNQDPDTAYYLCEQCGGCFQQSDYLRVWTQGRWIEKLRQHHARRNLGRRGREDRGPGSESPR